MYNLYSFYFLITFYPDFILQGDFSPEVISGNAHLLIKIDFGG